MENIPFHKLEDIKRVAKYTPSELYVITKQAIGTKLQAKIVQEHFRVLDSHRTISDTKIISIMRLYKDRENMILISSDSDFAKEANSYIKKHKLHWILNEPNKKRVLMYVNLSSPNLTLSVIPHKKKKQFIIHSQNSLNKTTEIGSRYNLGTYLEYYKAKVQRALKPSKKLYKQTLYKIKKTKALQRFLRTNKEEIVSINPMKEKRV